MPRSATNPLASGSLGALQSRLAAAQRADAAGDLTLDESTLGAEGAGLAALLRGRLGVASIALAGAQITAGTDGRSMSVAGAAGAMAVQLDFAAGAGALPVSLAVAGSQAELAAAFPALAPDLFDAAGIVAGQTLTAKLAVPGLPQLTLTDARTGVAGSSTPDGDTFQLTLAPRVAGALGDPALQLVVNLPCDTSGWLVAQAPGTAWTLAQMAGAVVPGLPLQSATAGLPQPLNDLASLALHDFALLLDPQFPTLNQIRFGVAGKDGGPLLKVGTGIELADVTLSLQLQYDGGGGLALTGAGWIEASAAIDDVPIGVHIPLPLGQGTLSLSSRPNLALLDLAKLASFVSEGAAQPADVVPPTFAKPAATLALTYLAVAVNTATPTIASAALSIELTEPWTIIEDRLELAGLYAGFTIENPASADRAVLGSATGVFQIGAADVYAAVGRNSPDDTWGVSVISPLIPLPSLQNLATLAGEDVQLSTLLPGDLVTRPFELSDLALDVQLDPPALQRIGFTLGLAPLPDPSQRPTWSPSESVFAVEQLAASADLDWRAGALATSVTIAGVFDIGGTAVTVSASRPAAAGAGWIFAGDTTVIQVGQLIDHLTNEHKVGVPGFLKHVALDQLAFTYATATGAFTFTCDGHLPIETGAAAIRVEVRLSDGASDAEYGGSLQIGANQFGFAVASAAGADALVATYEHAGGAVNVADMVRPLSDHAASRIPSGLAVDVKDIFLVATWDDAGASMFVLGADLGAHLSLSNLPLVGKELPPADSASVDDLRVVVASRALSASDTAAINAALTAGTAPLAATVPEGLTVAATMRFGGDARQLQIPVAAGGDAQPALSSGAAPAAAVGASWYNLQKSFGPVHFQRVGVQYRDGAIWFLLDASLTAAGLTMALDGLQLGSPLDHFAPRFDLRGLGVDYSNAEVEIGGAFARRQITVDGQPADEYDGMATVRASQLALGAIGSYSKLGGHPSLFIYAWLDAPLGGPPFFFVTGLALGFGYNRALSVPPVGQLADFPLIAEAVAGVSGLKAGDKVADRVAGELATFQQYIDESIGALFLAAGVRFTTFNLLDTFALLTVSLGHVFEVDLLGLSTMVVPTPEEGEDVPPLAEAQLALKAGFIPSQGFLGASAQLTAASFLFARQCHLTGGFAFFAWLTGDFVLTLGGYHPHFKKPDRYPAVPRLGFSWQVDQHLALKGESYYALTPRALMAGGDLQAVWQSGDLSAWFIAAADFLIAWKPYHYEAEALVDIGAACTIHVAGTHHITVNAGASLQMWGPEFSGHAHVHLSVISFTVSFGKGPAKAPGPIEWATFAASFLPDERQVCTITLQDGAAAGPTSAADPVFVNPQQLAIVTSSAIPARAVTAGGAALPLPAAPDCVTSFGIAPMDVDTFTLDDGQTVDDLTSTHAVTIVYEDGSSAESLFRIEPVLKSVPSALWGRSHTPALDGEALVGPAPAGVSIRPAAPPTPGATAELPVETLLDEGEPGGGAVWAAIPAWTAAASGDARAALAQSISADETVAARRALLAALVCTSTIAVDASVADMFVLAPQIAA